jgi:hypothetical protein
MAEKGGVIPERDEKTISWIRVDGTGFVSLSQ